MHHLLTVKFGCCFILRLSLHQSWSDISGRYMQLIQPKLTLLCGRLAFSFDNELITFFNLVFEVWYLVHMFFYKIWNMTYTIYTCIVSYCMKKKEEYLQPIKLWQTFERVWFDYCDLIERKFTTKHKIHHCTKPGDTV